jgi:hypothetical protein
MLKYIGPLTIILMLGMVLARVLLLKARGIKAMRFGETNKTDFLIPPFALFYFYIVFAAAFGWPTVAHRPLFQSDVAAWAGVLCCAAVRAELSHRHRCGSAGRADHLRHLRL